MLGFDLFYLLQNPQATTAHATVNFLLPSGTTISRTYTLAPGSRTTIYVNQVEGLDETDVSGGVSADAPIVVERAMYRSLPGQPFALGHQLDGRAGGGDVVVPGRGRDRRVLRSLRADCQPRHHGRQRDRAVTPSRTAPS